MVFVDLPRMRFVFVVPFERPSDALAVLSFAASRTSERIPRQSGLGKWLSCLSCPLLPQVPVVHQRPARRYFLGKSPVRSCRSKSQQRHWKGPL